jgi:hypothetical protein
MIAKPTETGNYAKRWLSKGEMQGIKHSKWQENESIDVSELVV